MVKRKRQSKYATELRERIVNLVGQGQTVRELATEFQIDASTIRGWLRQTAIDAGEREGLSTDERGELVRLRHEVARLTEERDILKKFAAWSTLEWKTKRSLPNVNYISPSTTITSPQLRWSAAG